MLENNKSDTRVLIGNISIFVALLILSIGCWNEYTWYEVMAPLGTVISFAFLCVSFFCYVDVKEAIKDKEVWLMAAGDLLALIHIVLIKSGFGAFFTVSTLLMALYLADKLIISRLQFIISGIYLAFYFYYWTFDVKGYFKGYNTNYGGLVLITGYVFAMVMLFYAQGILRKKGKDIYAKLMYAPILFMFAWGYNIISWYRARCALIGLITVALLILLPRKMWKRKVLYGLLCFAVTFGAIAISWLYIMLGRIKDVFTIQIFYKDILSGRDEIWGELWRAYLDHPITGIGSNYVMKLEWMGGMFEVHNGLLDILIVHGIAVFVITMILLVSRLLKLREKAASSTLNKVMMAGIVAILVSSFMENFFIVPPFTLAFMILLSYGQEKNSFE